MLLKNANLILKALNASFAVFTVLGEVFFDLFELSLGLTQLFLGQLLCLLADSEVLLEFLGVKPWSVCFFNLRRHHRGEDTLL